VSGDWSNTKNSYLVLALPFRVRVVRGAWNPAKEDDNGILLGWNKAKAEDVFPATGIAVQNQFTKCRLFVQLDFLQEMID